MTFPKIRLIEDWKKIWQKYTFWFFVVLGSLPQLWDAAVVSGLFDSPLIPPEFKLLVGTISALGILARMLKQNIAAMEAEVNAKLIEEAAKEAAAKK
jgi:hypothetical protein